MWGKIGLDSGAAVKGITERVRDDANRVGRKRLTHYILAEKGSEETGTEGLSFGFFVSPRRKIHNILWHVKKIPGFSMFFFPSGPLCPGESCDIMTVTVIIYEGIYEY